MKQLFGSLFIFFLITIPVFAATGAIDTSLNLFSLIFTGLGLILTLITALGAVAFTLYKQLENLRKEFKLELSSLKIELESDAKERLNIHNTLLSNKIENHKEKITLMQSSLEHLWLRYNNRGKRYSKFAYSSEEKLQHLLGGYEYMREILEEHGHDLKDIFSKLNMTKHQHTKLEKIEKLTSINFKDTIDSNLQGD